MNASQRSKRRQVTAQCLQSIIPKITLARAELISCKKIEFVLSVGFLIVQILATITGTIFRFNQSLFSYWNYTE